MNKVRPPAGTTTTLPLMRQMSREQTKWSFHVTRPSLEVGFAPGFSVFNMRASQNFAHCSPLQRLPSKPTTSFTKSHCHFTSPSFVIANTCAPSVAKYTRSLPMTGVLKIGSCTSISFTTAPVARSST